MAGLVSNLINELNGQIELYREIIALSQQKREFLIKNDIENLRKIVAQENTLVPRALRGDKDREAIIKNICTVINKNPEDMTLTRFVTLMENQPQHEELKGAVERIVAAAKELKELNEANKILVESSLDFISYTMNAIQSSFNAMPAGYGDTLSHEYEGKNFLDING